jgi:hypothetical protein
VRTPICLRAGTAWRVATCAAGANKNPIPTSRIAWPMRVKGTSMRTPSASSTSAEPLRELAARFPCLATRAPAAAATIAAAVEILNVPDPSPPVPHVSTMCSGRSWPSAKTGAACRRIAVANPTSSATCTGRRFSASSSRTISCVSTRPHSSSSIVSSASARVKTCPPSIRSTSVVILCFRASLLRSSLRGVLAPF